MKPMKPMKHLKSYENSNCKIPKTPKFKIGDKVYCINNSVSALEKDTEYTISIVDYIYYGLKELNNNKAIWDESRFMSSQEYLYLKYNI